MPRVPLYSADQARSAEAKMLQDQPEAVLMQRAATGCAQVAWSLIQHRTCPRVVLLVGPGNNGGDALWTGVLLQQRGAQVDALCISERCHTEGLFALHASGSRSVQVLSEAAARTHLELISSADLVIDGIAGLGSKGPLQPHVALLVSAATGLLLAIDIPSGIDAQTGCLTDPERVVTATHTVTMGCLKSSLFVAPARQHVGTLYCVDLGLQPYLPSPIAHLMDSEELLSWWQQPATSDHKYRRGVVGVAAGSTSYPGAAYLAVAGARCGGAGMVRVWSEAPHLIDQVVQTFWDVVPHPQLTDHPEKINGWVAGPGLASVDPILMEQVIQQTGPLVLDATLLATLSPSSPWRASLQGRAALGAYTLCTPHAGELSHLAEGQALEHLDSDPIQGTLALAQDLQAIVVRKGPSTLIAGPEGSCWIDPWGTAALSTAGSGDVLSGLLGSLCTRWWRSGRLQPNGWPEATAAAAAAVALHSLAGQALASSSFPVTAQALADSLPQTACHLSALCPPIVHWITP